MSALDGAPTFARMPFSSSYRPDPLFAGLGPAFSDAVTPAAFPDVQLRVRDQAAARELGLDTLSADEWRQHFAGFAPLPDNQAQPLAMRYHGHQFRVYNPQIGDGRGFLFAQMRDQQGRLIDLGAKGSGTTPYSRDGDGRMTLQGAVREVLAASFLQAAGVPTCQILSVYETGEALTRYDEPSPTRGAVMVRAQHSHVRIGTFQRHAYFEDAEAIGTLIAHCGEAYFPDSLAVAEDERPLAFLRAVVAANAHLAARWMAAGFVHGVLNTDNITVTGTSFDYGPFRFLPVYEPAFTAAYFDQGGIYAYGRQGEAVAWNLQQLAGCLTLVTPNVDGLEAALNGFGPAYLAELGGAFADRLGVARLGGEADGDLANAFARFAYDSRAAFEGVIFDWFGGDEAEPRAMDGPRASRYVGQTFDRFRAALAGRAPSAHGARPNDPIWNGGAWSPTLERVQDIWARIDNDDDWSGFDDALARIEALGIAYGLMPAQGIDAQSV